MIQSNSDVTNAFLDGMNKGLVVRLLIIIQIEKKILLHDRFCISYSPLVHEKLKCPSIQNIIHHFILIKKTYKLYI
jgi:hypothetical protein